MIATQAKIIDILKYPKVHAMLTNGAIVAQLSGLIGEDLDDLQTFLATGQSPKYDPETILGIWDIDRAATIAQVRKKQPGHFEKQLGRKSRSCFRSSPGPLLDRHAGSPNDFKTAQPRTIREHVVAAGTWKKTRTLRGQSARFAAGNVRDRNRGEQSAVSAKIRLRAGFRQRVVKEIIHGQSFRIREQRAGRHYCRAKRA
jgi:hypothetical protein